ncbi:dynactin p62 family-domain-containing protein [Russula earlei]|uniref:Dynactin p62 family-domain-containing protein n=1 Tax=Russula earlei TaxID=71964 RepID=A0ACC0UAU5_9AGAM|nr:dynactin p62 family-domain-containing protein [Russula earlei]
MTPSVLYHCPCLSTDPAPPPPNTPSSSYRFHPLHELFFCEECDAVRCNRCVSVEVSGYHCPNCLFEVPSASVRAEKNRCARNCFMCPNCRNTLSVVPSDPPDADDGRASVANLSPVGEPPFFLYCNYCRWDSAEVDMTFEKPTGLAAQLQKFEDSAPESLEFERLKEHFEPFLRASSSSSSGLSHANHSHATPVNPITAAASSALARDIPGVGKYTPAPRGRRDKGARDEISEYRSRVEVGGTKDAANVDFMRRLEAVSQVAALGQRWANSWSTTLRASEMKPLRIPLHSKKTKRCPTCRHILIKPEQKAQSVRFKIKLVAANYLPAMTVAFPSSQDSARQRGAGGRQATVEDKSGASGLYAGGTYPFHLALTNPLYDPIQVRLAVQRQIPPPSSSVPSASPEKAPARRPPFAVSLPQSAFPVAAFAEAWEYEDDEDMFGGEEDEIGGLDREHGGPGGKGKTVGVLERRANVTVVGGEVVVGRDAKGPVKFNMLVSYTYRSDDPLAEDDVRATPSRKEKAPEMKTFTFYTVVDLGLVVPRPRTGAE